MILLHGSNSWAREMMPLAEALRPFTGCHIPNLLGHGGRPVPERFTVDAFARDLMAWMDSQSVDRDFLVGFSTGGYLAVYAARHYPKRVKGAVAIATKFVFDERAVSHFTFLCSFERFEPSGKPPHVRVPLMDLNHRPQDWHDVVMRNQQMFRELGERPELADSDLAAITVPVLLICGDQDPLVTSEETQQVHSRIPGAEILVLRGSSHPLTVLPLDLLGQAIVAWTQRAGRLAS